MKNNKLFNLSLTLLAVTCLTACHKSEQTASGVQTVMQEKKITDATITPSQEKASEIKATDSKTDSNQTETSEIKNTTEQVPTQQPTDTPIAQDTTEASVNNNQTIQTNPTEQAISHQSHSTTASISPGAATGFWQNALGYSQTIHPDGRIDDGDYIITDVTQEANGVLYLTVYSQSSGWGGYMHYYPAGTPLIFNVSSYDEEGNLITESKDYTDSSRDRIFSGNGGYSTFKDNLDSYLADIYYR